MTKINVHSRRYISSKRLFENGNGKLYYLLKWFYNDGDYNTIKDTRR